MYDKFGFTTTNLGLADINFLENNTQDFKANENKETGSLFYSCRVKNMMCTISDYRIKIFGSPASFLYGNNFITLKYTDLNQFIEQMNDAFGMDVTRMKIYLLDITDNLIMDHKPIVYKRYMGKCRYFQRCDYEYNGLDYRNKQHKLLFYDKTLEFTCKKKLVPKEYQDKNVWRYEYSIKKKVHRKLGSPLIRITDLLDLDTYIKTVNVWEQMFNTIQLVDSDIRETIKPADMKRDDYLLVSGIMANGGLRSVLADIDEDFQMKEVKYDTANRRKNRYIKLIDEYNRLAPDNKSLKDELFRKVKEKAEENRMSCNS